MVKHERPYKVMRAFERHDGKALRKYARGSIISAKDAAKMDINNPKKYPGAILSRCSSHPERSTRCRPGRRIRHPPQRKLPSRR